MSTFLPLQREHHTVIYDGSPIPGWLFHIEVCSEHKNTFHVDASFGNDNIEFDYRAETSELHQKTFNNIMGIAKRLFIHLATQQLNEIKEERPTHVN